MCYTYSAELVGVGDVVTGLLIQSANMRRSVFLLAVINYNLFCHLSHISRAGALCQSGKKSVQSELNNPINN